MDNSTNSLVDSVVQLTTRSGTLAAAALGYRMFSSIVDLEVVPRSPSPTPSLETCDDVVKGDGLGSSNMSTAKANAGFFSKDWFWGSSKTPTQQYSTIGFDKESGLPLFTLQEVSLHDMHHDCWIVLYDRVYDITCFLNSHPGGDEVMLEYAGHDATIAFRGVGHSKEAEESLKPYLIGILVESERIWTRFFNMRSDVP